jgi:hypothetical protein
MTITKSEKPFFRVAQQIVHTSRTLNARNRMFNSDTHLEYFAVDMLILKGSTYSNFSGVRLVSEIN